MPDDFSGAAQMAVLRRLRERFAESREPLQFVGAGYYEHHVPAACLQAWADAAPADRVAATDRVARWLSRRLGMAECAVGYADAADALIHAVQAALAADCRGRRALWVTRGVNPRLRDRLRIAFAPQGVAVLEAPLDDDTGLSALSGGPRHDVAVLVYAQPSFLGLMEPAAHIRRICQVADVRCIACVNPRVVTAAAVDADWLCGDAQPLGLPLAAGGASLGFVASAGRGRPRRPAAPHANVAAVAALLATISIQQLDDINRVAVRAARTLCERLTALDGVRCRFPSGWRHEFVLQSEVPAAQMLRALAAQNIIGGVDLSRDYPEFGEAILICVTETKTADDLQRFHDHWARILKRRAPITCPVKPKW